MSDIEKFTPAFPKSQFGIQISQLALYSLRQLNQPQRLLAYGEKTLATNPDGIPTLLMMADAYAADPEADREGCDVCQQGNHLVGPTPRQTTRPSGCRQAWRTRH